MEISVPSFEIDHTTLKAGLYLRQIIEIGNSRIFIWDLRFVAPSAKRPMSIKVAHSIEHIMALKLRYALGDSYIGFYVMGCCTGFTFVSKDDVSSEDLTEVLIDVIDATIPLVSKQEIPCLTEKECGNPNSYAIKATNDYLNEYLNVLKSL